MDYVVNPETDAKMRAGDIGAPVCVTLNPGSEDAKVLRIVSKSPSASLSGSPAL